MQQSDWQFTGRALLFQEALTKKMNLTNPK